MGKRGPSSFKKLDVERAIRSAREGGLEPGMMVEIETKDGGIIRVFGSKAAAETTKEVMDAELWDREIEKVKKDSDKTKRR
jgi:hypothetical protein